MHGTLLKNFSFLTVSSILMPFASMALVVAISRFGGVEMLGEYSLLLTFFFIGQTCSTAGLQILITREAARRREFAGAYLFAGSIIGIVTAFAISAILIPSFAWTVPDRAVRISLLCMAAALVPTVVAGLAESVLLAFERVEDFVLISFVESLVRTVIGTVLICLGWGIVSIAATFLLCRAVAAWATVWRVKIRGSNIRFEFDRESLDLLLHQFPVVGAIPVLNSLYWRLDTLLLTWMRGLADVGYYGASTRILDITRNIPQAYARALYPALSRLSQDDRSAFESLSRQSLIWIVMATFPLALATSTLAQWIITTLYGPAMTPAILGLEIVSWLMIPYALTSTLAQILFASGNQSLDLRVNLVAVLTSAALNLALIPRYGFVGSSVASLLTMAMHVSLQYRYVRLRVFDLEVLTPIRNIMLVGLASWLVTLLARRYHPFLVTPLGLACYLLGLWAVGLLGRRHAVAAWTYGRAAVRSASLRFASPTRSS